MRECIAFYVCLPQIKKQEELLEIIGKYDGLVVRSGVTVDEDLIAAATNMRIVGRAGTGETLSAVPITKPTKGYVLPYHPGAFLGYSSIFFVPPRVCSAVGGMGSYVAPCT